MAFFEGYNMIFMAKYFISIQKLYVTINQLFWWLQNFYGRITFQDALPAIYLSSLFKRYNPYASYSIVYQHTSNTNSKCTNDKDTQKCLSGYLKNVRLLHLLWFLRRCVTEICIKITDVLKFVVLSKSVSIPAS